MSRVIVLDSGVLGLVSNPHATPQNEAARTWLENLTAKGDQIIIPEIADYEVRRELIRAGKLRGLRRLSAILLSYTYVPLTTAAMRKAAEFWAQVRRQGKSTASDDALDGDVILAAQASLLPKQVGTPILIATTNVKHLSLFADAREWTKI